MREQAKVGTISFDPEFPILIYVIGGRNVLISLDTGRELNSAPWNICAAVHDYGGAPCIIEDDILYFSNLSDGRIYISKVQGGEEPAAVTPSKRYVTNR